MSESLRAELAQMTDNRLAIGVEPGVTGVEDWAAVREALNMASKYRQMTHPVDVHVLGPTLAQYKDSGDPGYLQRSADLRLASIKYPALRRVRHLLLKQITSLVGVEPTPLVLSGLSCEWGVLRKMDQGTLVHWDDLNVEVRGLGAPKLDCQFAFNLFLEAPSGGGEVVLYDSLRGQGLERSRRAFGYADEATAGLESLEYIPARGDLVFFNSRLLHTVRKCAKGERVSCSAFVGLFGGEAVIWS